MRNQMMALEAASRTSQLPPPSTVPGVKGAWFICIVDQEGNAETTGPMSYPEVVNFHTIVLPMRCITDVVVWKGAEY